MTIKSKILSMLACAVLFSACTKSDDDDDDDDNDNNSTKTELLEDSKWMLIAHTETITEDGEKETDDLYEDLEDCEKDDIAWFQKSGEVTTDQGSLKCEEDEPQTTTSGTWKLTDNGKKLALTSEDDETVTMEIAELTSSRLKLQSSYSDDGDKYETVMTYKRMN